MKLLICIVSLIFVTNAHQKTFEEVKQIWHSYVLKHSEKCLQETGADYNKAMRILPYGEYVDDHKVKCFLLCAANNLFITYDDGSTHHQNFLEILNIKDPEILKEANFVEKCFDIKMDDQCDTFYAVSECIFKAVEEIMTRNELRSSKK